MPGVGEQLEALLLGRSGSAGCGWGPCGLANRSRSAGVFRTLARETAPLPTVSVCAAARLSQGLARQTTTLARAVQVVVTHIKERPRDAPRTRTSVLRRMLAGALPRDPA